jgi:prolyl-tRNA synthetase
VKFKDAELIGVPRSSRSAAVLADGTVEVKDRRSGEREEVRVTEAAGHLLGVVRA